MEVMKLIKPKWHDKCFILNTNNNENNKITKSSKTKKETKYIDKDTSGISLVNDIEFKKAFNITISKLAEDFSNNKIEGEDFWDIDRLLLRKINKDIIYNCMNSFEKEKVIIILDTSPSCERQSLFFINIALLALRNGFIEIYTGDNGNIEKKLGDDNYIPKYETWGFTGKNVLFFGDFDGYEILKSESKRNNIYYFCCDNKFNPSTVSDLKAKTFKVKNRDDFIESSKRLR